LASTSQGSYARPYSGILLYLLVFFGGFANLATEIIGPRMFASIFGETTIIWAIIISVTLVGLSIGYMIGGRIEHTRIRSILPLLLLVNALWLVAISWLVWQVPADAAAQGLAVDSAVVLTTAMSAFFVPSLLFGTISPMVISLLSENTSPEGMSRIVGNVYALGTIGSVSGALSAAFILIPYVGLTRSLQGFALILAGLAACLWLPSRRLMAAGVGLLCVLLPQPDFQWQNDEGLRLVEQREGYYQTVRVYTDDQTFMQMHLGPTFHSRIDLNTREPLFSYATAMLQYVGDVSGKRALIIGGAGHGLAHYLENRGASVTEVEIDPIVVELSDRHFGEIRGETVIQDGRVFIENAVPSTYDLILIDAFDGGGSVPAQLATREFFEGVRKALKPDGRMLYNFIGTPEGERSASFRALATTIRQVFENAGYERVNSETEDTINQNIILAASPTATFSLTALPNDGNLLTDDLNPIDILIENARTRFYFRR
jgi:spermidine synthase